MKAVDKLETESKRLARVKIQKAECKQILRNEKKHLEVENVATLKEFNQHQQEMINVEEDLELVGAQRPAIVNLFERTRQSRKRGGANTHGQH